MISALRLFRRTALLAVAICCSPFLPAQPAVTARLAAPISSQAGRVALAHTAEPRATVAEDLGSAPASAVLPEMTIRFSLTSSQTEALDKLLAEQHNPDSPLFQKWLTPDTFAAKFGMAESDLAKVREWLTAQGFAITQTGRARNFISFRGTVAQAQTAFGTQIHLLRADGETHMANVTDIALPTALSQTVLSVQGLSDFAPKPHYNSSTGNHFVVPEDIQTIYDVKSAHTAGYTGSGITIVVPGQATIDLANINAFRSLSGLPAKTLTVKTYAAPRNGAGDDTESYADVEWAGALAPDADLIYVTSNNVYISLQYAIDNNLGAVVAMSYGTCEGIVSSSSKDYLNAVGQEANTFGITIVASSGDSGAMDCEVHGAGGPTAGTTGLNVDMPASSPYYLAVGGTVFNEGAGTYWNATNSATYGSAKGYIPEVAWNESGSTYHLFASGGGASAYFIKPSWQTGTGVPADGKRDVPDVALTAGAHDAYLICLPGYCATGFRNSTGSTFAIAGTSIAAPNVAGMMALVVQKAGSRIGNPNPRIYTLAASSAGSSVFHDIVSGDNKVPCKAGTTGCPSGGTIGYTAGVGYDQVTGWGSIDAANLVNTWALSSGSGGTGGNGLLTSTTSVTSSASQGVINTSLNFTAKVTGTGTVPTGTAYFLVNGSLEDFASLVNGQLTRPLDLTTSNNFQIGDNVVSVRYSGDTVYAASVSEIHVLVTTTSVTPVVDFAITPATKAVTVAAGGTVNVDYVLASSTGFAGNIALSLSSTSASFKGCPKFTPASVTLSSGANSATSTLTLKTASCGSTAASLSHAPSAGGRRGGSLAGGGLALAALLMLSRPRRRRWASLVGAVLLGVASMSLSGCGSGGDVSKLFNGGGATTAPVVNSPAGSYDLIVSATATNGSGVASSKYAVLTVTVQ